MVNLLRAWMMTYLLRAELKGEYEIPLKFIPRDECGETVYKECEYVM